MSWRLVHDDNKVYALLESEGTTYTLKSLLYFDTLEESFSKIDELKLEYTYLSGGSSKIIFSGGTRTAKEIGDIEDIEI